MNKTEIIDDIEIKYKKHIFSKHIKITLKQERLVLITMPYYCTYKKARDFLLSNLDKIKSFKFSEKIYNEDFKTKFDSLKIIKSDFNKIELKKGIVYLYYSGDFLSKNNQKAFLEAYLKALKIEAKNYLIPRLAFLADKYNFKYNKVALRNQKTRFGSCSYRNNINLNINLMKHDFDCIDYVLIHELVHTKVKNHSKSFWLEVEKCCPNYREIRKKLKSL